MQKQILIKMTRGVGKLKQQFNKDWIFKLYLWPKVNNASWAGDLETGGQILGRLKLTHCCKRSVQHLLE